MSDGLYPQKRSLRSALRRSETTKTDYPRVRLLAETLPLLAARSLVLFGRPARLGDVLGPQLGGLVPLQRFALHAHLFFGDRAARSIGVRPAARAHLGGLALRGAGPELTPGQLLPRLGLRALFEGTLASPSLFLEDHVAYGHVQLGDPEPRHVLDALGDPAPHRFDGRQDVPTVLDAQREVYGCLHRAGLGRDAPRLALRAGDAAQDPAGGPSSA